jgi:hypothetical protein
MIPTYISIAEEIDTYTGGVTPAQVTDQYYFGGSGPTEGEAQSKALAKCNETIAAGQRNDPRIEIHNRTCSLKGTFIDKGTARFGHGSVGGE